MINQRALAGETFDIGADLFIAKVLPVIRRASRTMEGGSVIQVYAGVMLALYGSLCMEFGAAKGADHFRILSDSLMKTRPWERLAMTDFATPQQRPDEDGPRPANLHGSFRQSKRDEFPPSGPRALAQSLEEEYHDERYHESQLMSGDR